jgi:hypothetical protein
MDYTSAFHLHFFKDVLVEEQLPLVDETLAVVRDPQFGGN